MTASGPDGLVAAAEKRALGIGSALAVVDATVKGEVEAESEKTHG